MNRLFLTIGLVVLGIPASASTIFYEGFNDYAPGELAGKTLGTGWGGAWAAKTLNTEVKSPGAALTYTVPGGGTVNGGTSALELRNNDDSQIARSLDAAETGDVFFSFLYRQSAGLITDNDYLAFWFDNDTTVTGGQGQIPNIGEKANHGGPGLGGEDFMARLILGQNEAYSTSVTVGQTYFVVGRLFKSVPGVGTLYDRFSLWVNPDSFDTAATPDALSSFTGTTSSFLRLGVRGVNHAPDEIIFVDELSAGTLFADVVPVGAVVPIPEPTTLALLGLGLIGLGLSRRNRSRV